MTKNLRSGRRGRSALALLLAAGMAVAACGGSPSANAGTDTSTGTDNGAAATQERTATLVTQKIDGGQIDIADLLGQDVVLWFWAPW